MAAANGGSTGASGQRQPLFGAPIFVGWLNAEKQHFPGGLGILGHTLTLD